MAFVVLTASLVIVLGRLGTAAVSRAQARTAADAAALAGAAEGREAAEEVAAANGGHLESFDQSGADTEVTVTVGDAHATARARRDAGSGPAGADPARR